MKNTNKALFSSVVALILCCTMLIGSTFAWFTDEAKSGVNQIVSGNLDIALEMKDANGNWVDAEGQTLKFTDNYWEPGCTYVLPELRITNKGNLALKYNVVVNGINGDAKLLEVIDFTLSPEDGVLLPGKSVAVELSAHMAEEAGNEYQNKTLSGLGITVYATQYTYEKDSIDDTYDEDASIWDAVIAGEMPDTLVLEFADRAQDGGKVIVKDVCAFVYLNKLVEYFEANATQNPYNHYYYNMKWSVELAADIDLKNNAIDGINLGYFGAGLDGKGHTISNVVLKNGATSMLGQGNIKNLNIRNIVVNAPSANGVGAVVGNRGFLNNVHVVNAKVIGGKYVGGLAGKGSSFINCSIKDSTVTGTDKTVGGLVGYSIGDPGAATVSGNVVENVTVTGAYNVGGLLGQSQNETVEGNTIKNVTVTSTMGLPADASSNEVRTAAVAARSAFANTTIGTNTAVNVTLVNKFDGTIPTSLEKTTLEIVPGGGTQTGTITINTPYDLVYLNKLAAEWVSLYSNGLGTDVEKYYTSNGGKGADYYYHWQWTVELAADLDMSNIPMDSVDISYWGTFNGNNHTISNVVMKDGQGGLFNNGAKAINNLTVKNIIVNAPEAQTVGAVAGNGNMTNVHVVNATVTGGKYVGGLAGKGSSFINCSIKDSTVTGTDKTVGGLVGYSIGDPGAATVSGNIVENVTVTGAYNVGGLLGQSQNETVEGNTVKNVTVTSTKALPANASSNEVRTAEVAARSAFADTNIGTNTVENVTLQNR